MTTIIDNLADISLDLCNNKLLCVKTDSYDNVVCLGPSQQYGWVGHGTYAPYNIPNIFQAAGINTRWIPGIDPVFQVGLLYPDPAPAQSMSLNSYSPPSNNYGSSVKVKKSIPNSAYGNQKEAIEISPLPQLVKTKPQEAPAVPPPYTGPATSGDVSRPASAPGPALNPAVPPAFTRSVVKPAIPLASLGAVANPAVPPSYTGPAVAPSFSKIAVSPSTIGPAIPPPYSAPISVFESPTTTPSTTPRPWNQGTLTPFINLRGSPTPQGSIRKICLYKSLFFLSRLYKSYNIQTGIYFQYKQTILFGHKINCFPKEDINKKTT